MSFRNCMDADHAVIKQEFLGSCLCGNLCVNISYLAMYVIKPDCIIVSLSMFGSSVWQFDQLELQ